MDQKIINEYLKKGSLRKRTPDINRANSLISVAEITAEVVIKMPINESNATLVFREMYEALRQLGDAKLWKIGYESRQHEPSIKVLNDAKISNPLAFNNLDRFRTIRHGANYRGEKVTVDQAKEIVQFWNNYGKELLNWVRL